MQYNPSETNLPKWTQQLLDELRAENIRLREKASAGVSRIGWRRCAMCAPRAPIGNTSFRSNSTHPPHALLSASPARGAFRCTVGGAKKWCEIGALKVLTS